MPSGAATNAVSKPGESVLLRCIAGRTQSVHSKREQFSAASEARKSANGEWRMRSRCDRVDVR